MRLRFWELLTGPVLVVQEHEHIVLPVGSIGQYDVGLAILGVDKVPIGTHETVLVMELGHQGVCRPTAMIVLEVDVY